MINMDEYCKKTLEKAFMKWADDDSLSASELGDVLGELPRSKKFRGWVPTKEALDAKVKAKSLTSEPVDLSTFMAIMNEFYDVKDSQDDFVASETAEFFVEGLEEAKRELEENKSKRDIAVKKQNEREQEKNRLKEKSIEFKKQLAIEEKKWQESRAKKGDKSDAPSPVTRSPQEPNQSGGVRVETTAAPMHCGVESTEHEDVESKQVDRVKECSPQDKEDDESEDEPKAVKDEESKEAAEEGEEKEHDHHQTRDQEQEHPKEEYEEKDERSQDTLQDEVAGQTQRRQETSKPKAQPQKHPQQEESQLNTQQDQDEVQEKRQGEAAGQPHSQHEKPKEQSSTQIHERNQPSDRPQHHRQGEQVEEEKQKSNGPGEKMLLEALEHAKPLKHIDSAFIRHKKKEKEKEKEKTNTRFLKEELIATHEKLRPEPSKKSSVEEMLRQENEDLRLMLAVARLDNRKALEALEAAETRARALEDAFRKHLMNCGRRRKG